MLLQISNIRDQCYCRFRTSGTNAIAHFEHQGPTLLQISNIGDRCYCTFRTSGPMLLHISNIRDQCYCTFRTSGALGTNATAPFEDRGLWGPMLLHISSMVGCGVQCYCTFRTLSAVRTNCEESPTVNGTRWCKRTDFVLQCCGILRVGGCFPYTN